MTLNAGSSSLKFALYTATATPRELLRGQIEGLCGDQPRMQASADGVAVTVAAMPATLDHGGALDAVIELLRERHGSTPPAAIGHRVVHGGLDFTAPCRVDASVRAALAALQPLAPLHQPHNLAGIDAAAARFPQAVQVACFDTAFHRQHPWVNDVFAIPRRFHEQGVRRYGFHGLSYEYVSGELARIAPHHARGRVVISHLGNGASMCAVRDGMSVGSTMGFSALDGLPMGTRCGQLDPGVLLYLMRSEGLDAAQISDILYHQSGLKGLSGISHDVRELLRSERPEAREALDYFVFWVRRELGAMTAILNGIDALVFCGGIGENAVPIREEICAGLDWLGLELDSQRNRASQTVISSTRSRVRAFVIHTDEERMIARHTASLLHGEGG